MKESVIITISGRVQGVGFRYFVKQKAEVCGICGFVKNLPDRQVYIEAEGSRTNLQVFIAMCKQGPSHARVEKAEVQFCPLQYFKDFSIK
jgi:acylphosphatase